MTRGNSVYYCYAVARPFPAEELRDVRGVHDAPIELVEHGDLVAVASPVPSEEFSESALRANMEDLAWLEGVARAHNDVVDQIARTAVTLPFSLATIYWNVDRVREVLRADHPRLSEALDRIEGHREWGVKVYSVEEAGPRTSRAGSAESGRAYLRQRMQQRDAREGALEHAEEGAQEIDEVLSALASARRRHRTQNSELSGARGQNVFNVAYLVHSEKEQTFADEVEHLRTRLTQCRVELTGPWVPYSFALDQAREADSGE